MQRRERRGDHDLDVLDVLHEAPQFLRKQDGIVHRFEHLPVACDEGGSHGLSLSAATPGSVRPPRNSSDAPPPVEICVIRSLTAAFCTAAIESPPPTMVVPRTAATERAIAVVPVAN